MIKVERHGGAYDYSVFDGRCGFVGRAAGKLHIEVGEDVKFATQGKLMLILDRAGKTHRTQFRLQWLAPLPAPIAKQDK